MRKFNILLVCGVFTLMMGCSGEKTDKTPAADMSSSAPAASSQEFDKVIGDAEKAYNDAVSMGAAWRDTDKLLQKARAAAAGNDVGKATQFAQQALTESEMAMQQSKEQENAGPHLF